MTRFLASDWMKRVTVLMAVIMVLVGMVPPLEAGFISSQESAPDFVRSRDMALVQKTLENKMIAERLSALGYDRQEIQARLDQLSDQEIHALAAEMESVEPAAGVAGGVIAVLVILVLVLVILRLVGKRVVVD